MVATDQSNPICIPHFEGQQQQKCFDAVEPAIHKIAHEQVVRVWAVPSNLEQFDQIIELPVDVTADRHGRIHTLDIALLHENF